MRFLCFGLGAIGTYIGGSLLDAGDEVVFIERAESIPYIHENGIRLLTTERKIRLQNVKVVSSIDEAMGEQEFDCCILAVKSFDTAGVLETIRPYAEKFPPILCLQNGVENEILIEAALGKAKVIGGSVTSAVSRMGVGEAEVEKFRGVGIENSHAISSMLIEHFIRAGLRGVGYPCRADLKWSKLLTNLQANAVSAILNWTPSMVFHDPVSYHIEVTAMKEAVRVMHAIGAKVVNLPGTPVKPWVDAMVRWPEWISRPVIGQLLGKGRGAKMPSFHIDLYAGRKQSEVIFLNGAVCRFGEKNSIPTPVNQVLTETLVTLAEQRMERSTFENKPDLLMKKIEERI